MTDPHSDFARIARFADAHDRPRPSEVTADGVVIYSTDILRDGSIQTASDLVKTMEEARTVLGY